MKTELVVLRFDTGQMIKYSKVSIPMASQTILLFPQQLPENVMSSR